MNVRLLISATSLVLVAASPASSTSPEALSLAQRIVEVSHHQQLTRDTYAKELRGAMTFCKADQTCQVDLDRAIMRAASEVSDKYAASMTQILARKLTTTQLQAALKFYQSPDGQAIVAAESQWSDEMAQIGLASMAHAQKVISESFCPSHPEICANAVGRHPPSSPKS